MGKQAEVRERWRERIAAQEASALSVRAYCKEHGIGEHSFYAWRQKLRRTGEPVGFALVRAKPQEAEGTIRTVDLLLAGGECLRIPCEEAALRIVLRAIGALE
jgi:transposase-like protein